MSDRTMGLLMLVGAAVAAFVAGPVKVSPDRGPPAPLVKPAPEPRPTPRRPLLPRRPRSSLSSEAFVGGPVGRDGTEVLCDLPGSLHQKNAAGSDGAGLCVYASARHSGLWQDDEVFQGLFDWMRRHPGGSYPEKFDRTVRQFCEEKGLPVPRYLQVQSNDLEILRAACASGRMPGVTYSFSPTGRYSGRRISHMVSLVHAGPRWFVILDNNYPGEEKLEWLTPEEFRRAYTGGRTGWAVINLEPGPPPIPH